MGFGVNGSCEYVICINRNAFDRLEMAICMDWPPLRAAGAPSVLKTLGACFLILVAITNNIIVHI